LNIFYFFLRSLTQPAYRIRGVGLGRLCELTRRWAAKNGPNHPLLIKDFRGHARFLCHLKEHMGGQIFFKGAYSGDQLSLIEKILGPEGVFLDIGANQGEFSIAAAKVVQFGKVMAFEPVTEYRDRLIANIALNGFGNVQVFPVALGEQEGTLPIYDEKSSFEDGTRNEGLPTLFAFGSRNYPREVVQVRRLDDVLAEQDVHRVDLIKLDIEGAEWMALRGAKSTIQRYRPVLILEIGRETCLSAGYDPEALVAWLQAMEYRIEKIVEGGKTLSMPPARLDDFQNVVAFPI
jgi:FkbM family methyltransferase